jgi:hypothetical protein
VTAGWTERWRTQHRNSRDWNLTEKSFKVVEQYFARLRDEHGLGAGTKERSYYPALADLLNTLGQEWKPKVICL